MPMELKIKEEEYNALLKRKEIQAEVEHDQAGTPSRADLRKTVASKYGVKPESVYVVEVETKTGSQNAHLKVQVYDDREAAERIVPKYIQTRHLPAEERKRVREELAKKAEAKPKPEKPKEKAKEEKPKEETKSPADAPKKEADAK